MRHAGLSLSTIREAGPAARAGQLRPREKENWNPKLVNVEGRYQTKEHWKDRTGNDLHPHTNYYVGGNTKFYGAAFLRLGLSRTTNWSPTMARPNVCITYMGRAEKIQQSQLRVRLTPTR
ncbi:MAG: hypothetical protein ACJ746_16110 [Bryobacteraceae bacterium]